MTSLFYLESSKLGILILFSIFLGFIIILMSYIVSYYLAYVEKLAAYECGFDPYEDARNMFDVKFYLVSILFLIFDLEAAYFYPWCVSFSFLTIDAVWVMFDFIIELLVGYFYAWVIGALDWN